MAFLVTLLHPGFIRATRRSLSIALLIGKTPPFSSWTLGPSNPKPRKFRLKDTGARPYTRATSPTWGGGVCAVRSLGGRAGSVPGLANLCVAQLFRPRSFCISHITYLPCSVDQAAATLRLVYVYTCLKYSAPSLPTDSVSCCAWVVGSWVVWGRGEGNAAAPSAQVGTEVDARGVSRYSPPSWVHNLLLGCRDSGPGNVLLLPVDTGGRWCTLAVSLAPSSSFPSWALSAKAKSRSPSL